MSAVKSNVSVEVTVTFTITEEEARALDALAGYGDDAALEAFYKGCGRYYLEPYEKGLRKFLKNVGSYVSPALNQVDDARKRLKESYKDSK